jgi:hydrogenase expression/formation protein HypE
MRAGKLPNDHLADLLSRVGHGDPRVVVGPAVGRDAAVIDTGGPRLLVAKTDPITFATGEIGWYAVHVNANDIACMGGRPAWFLATVLLPEGCDQGLPGAILDDITEACSSLGIELVGGHTEVTIGLDRPIVVGAMLGEADRDRIVRPESARPGDAVILTKGIAIEGTAVLARESRERLISAGLSEATIDAAAGMLRNPGISVVREADAVLNVAEVHAMHDPTEGGLATALYELAASTGCGIRVDAESINVLPETAEVCRALELDHLGLLASGALLVVVSVDAVSRTLRAVGDAGVEAARIGSLSPKEDGVIIWANSESRPVPRFERDEVARYLSEVPG